MAILFDWYELPEPKDKQREEKILHPRIRLNGSTTTDELRRRIQERSSLTETDVSAVLDALSHVMGEDLAEGRQVHLSDKEIDRRLTGYFSTHQFLTRESFQVLCGMMRSTAQLHIRLLRSEGKLENAGKLNQPIYVPCTGYYGRDE